VYKGGTVQYVEKWRNGDRVLIPPPRASQVLKHIGLPAGSEPFVGLEELMSNVACFFKSCLDVEVIWRTLMTAFVFSSWFREKLPVAPYLALLGPPGSGKTTAMRILSLLCRRGLLTSDISSAAFYDVSHRLGPTLLIDETATAGHPRTLLHLLRSSSSPGFVSLRKDKAQMAFGPKVFAWIELPNDAPLNSRCIIIPMHKTSRTDLISPDDPKVLQFAKKVRMRLQQFRFEHYRSLSVPKVPADVQLSSRALDLYRALALPFGADQIFCNILADLLTAQRQFQSRLLSATQASAVRVLYSLIHVEPSAPGYRLSGLTTEMKGDLASRGEPSRLNERKAGDILTSLGLTNRSRTNTGYVLWVERSDRVRIHEMARDYEVDGTGAKQNCDICKETSTASPASGTPEAVNPKQVRSDELKRERRERREHRLGRETRSQSGKRRLRKMARRRASSKPERGWWSEDHYMAWKKWLARKDRFSQWNAKKSSTLRFLYLLGRNLAWFLRLDGNRVEIAVDDSCLNSFVCWIQEVA
jgi:hypothetical protein